MIQIRAGYSRNEGGCVACDRYHTALGTAAHAVNVYRIGNERVASEFRLCAECESEFATKTRSPSKCCWEKDEDGIYHTACGDAFFFDTGTWAENGCVFCTYCGRKIEERPRPVCPQCGNAWEHDCDQLRAVSMVA